MKAPSFVHLHVHSEYSLEDGIIPVKALAQRCAEREMPAVAITDHGNLFALVKFYNAARGQGVKPLIGSEIWIRDATDADRPSSLILLCMNKTGYGHLSRLLSRGYLEGNQQGRPQIEAAWLDNASDGLIALSAAGQGEVGRALQGHDAAQAEALAERYARCFPDRFYLEIQRNGEENQEALVQTTVALAKKLDLPLVATNNAHFLDSADFAAFDARQCISAGLTLDDPRRPRRFTPEHCLPDPQVMRERFADLPEACDNTIEIARRCNLELVLGQYALPDYPIPTAQSVAEYLHDAAQKGLQERLEELRIQGDAALPYQQRLLREVGVILEMGFPGYFLIVADFIQWAKNNGVPVGPGRGSGAGSLVAYALRITDLDPIRNGLLFERFLNPERVSMPDFDVDFCMDQRDRVIQYVAEKYGRDRVGQIITFGTMKARAVVRDVGRVLGLPYGFVDQLAKLVPGDLGMTLAKALAESEDLRRRQAEEDDVRDLLDVALRLEGLPRHASTHAGGVVISPEPLADRLPLFTDSSGGGGNVTQLDKDDVEKMGLVKFDFLGLRTLTIIDMAVKLIHAAAPQDAEPLSIEHLPLDDVATFNLLKSTETVAVFQLESSGMRDLVRRLQPDTFEDIVALVALFRPGPLQSGMVDDFIARKHGRAPVTYLHPHLEAILKETYGVIVYQEQVMQSAQILAGYSLGGADLLRRAMGKKKPEEMAKQRSIFMEGAHKNGLNPEQAGAIFDLMEKFAEYGFNKSHSAAYALVSYQTAYLKAHYPQFFMAAVLTADMDHTDKVVAMIAECQRMGMQIMPPSVLHSGLEFRPEGEQNIRFGLGAIKGLGRAAIQAILEARSERPFGSLFDFLCRVDAQKINRRALEALIRAGAMDDWQISRADLIASLAAHVEAAAQFQQGQASQQESLFSGQEALPVAPSLVGGEAWTLTETLRQERETLGFYFSGHPMDSLREELAELGVQPLGGISAGTTVLVAGLVVARRSTRTKKGDRIYFLTLDDGLGRLEVVVFAEVWAQAGKIGEGEEPVLVLGEVGEDSYSGGLRLSALRVLDRATARAELALQLTLEFTASRIPDPEDLLTCLQQYPGSTLLRLRLPVEPDLWVQLRVDEKFSASAEAVAALQTLVPEGGWQWAYRPAATLVNNVIAMDRAPRKARRPA
ncbi:MAG: DNA polymerase III subunit alpha [Acidithiobacillus sp.]